METNEGVPLAELVMPTPYKDRHVGLVMFGIFTVLLGCICGLFVLLMLIGQMAGRTASAGQLPLSSILPAIVVYCIMAVVLVWLGIGSILARRWARALMLIFSWTWLAMGVLVFFFMMIFLPKMMAGISNGASGQPPMPPEAMMAMIITMGVILGVMFILMPGVWTFFYSSRHVKATCDARDPVMRWTDACPLPVLGLSAWLAFSAPTILITPIVSRGVVPFFGMFLSGIPGGMLWVIMACLWSYAAWALYKLQPRGWWIVFMTICLIMLSSFLTFTKHDAAEMYRLMGYPELQIAQMEKTGLLTGHRLIWLSGVWLLPVLGYLWFVRKFIFRKS